MSDKEKVEIVRPRISYYATFIKLMQITALVLGMWSENTTAMLIAITGVTLLNLTKEGIIVRVYEE